MGKFFTTTPNRARLGFLTNVKIAVALRPYPFVAKQILIHEVVAHIGQQHQLWLRYLRNSDPVRLGKTGFGGFTELTARMLDKRMIESIPGSVQLRELEKIQDPKVKRSMIEHWSYKKKHLLDDELREGNESEQRKGKGVSPENVTKFKEAYLRAEANHECYPPK